MMMMKNKFLLDSNPYFLGEFWIKINIEGKIFEDSFPYPYNSRRY